MVVGVGCMHGRKCRGRWWGRGQQALRGHHGRWWEGEARGGARMRSATASAVLVNVKEGRLLELKFVLYHIVDLVPEQIFNGVAFLDQVVEMVLASVSGSGSAGKRGLG